MTDQTSLSYKDAGVDIDAGEALVARIKSVAKATSRPEWWVAWADLGRFAAFRLAINHHCLCQARTALAPSLSLRYSLTAMKRLVKIWWQCV